MNAHDLLVTWRNLRRHRGFAMVNIAGLALGVGVCLLVLLYLHHELRYDAFHEHADRIVRVVSNSTFNDQRTHYVSTLEALAPAVVERFPQVRSAVRLLRLDRFYFRVGDRVLPRENGYFAEPEFWEVFSFPLVSGDRTTALARPYSIALSRSMAEALFGEADIAGQVLEIENMGDFEVTAVFEDVPATSHFHFDFLLSYATIRRDKQNPWDLMFSPTYLLLAPGTDREALRERINALIREHRADSPWQVEVEFQPLRSIHLTSHRRGELGDNSSMDYILAFGAAAVLILLVAAINYINLATARANERLREVGVRKSFGATRGRLARQFLVESAFLASLAVALGALLALLALPWLRQVMGSPISLAGIHPLAAVGLLAGFALLVGLGAGFYPAVLLSRADPVTVFRAEGRLGRTRSPLRRGFIVLQFTVSIALVVAALVIHRQLTYSMQAIRESDEAPVAGVIVQGLQDVEDVLTFREAAATLPGVRRTALTNLVPGGLALSLRYVPREDTTAAGVLAVTLEADGGFAPIFDLELIAGRNLPLRRDTEPDSLCLVTRQAARELGWTPDEAVGRRILSEQGRGGGGLLVVGVLEDFHVHTLHQPISPVVIRALPVVERVLLELEPAGRELTLRKLEAAWQEVLDAGPFRVQFHSQVVQQAHRNDRRLASVVTGFAALAIAIATLGLVAVTAYGLTVRRREIGIRVVLGATPLEVVRLMVGEVVVLLGIASLLAWALGGLAAGSWLEDFAYHISPGPLPFLLATLGALFTGVLVVALLAWRAARRRPVETLRSE